jgi:glycosyltransferase involved in cell wall biosynthesis
VFPEPSDYLMVLPVPFHRIGPGRIATESAFCEHLRLLRALLAPRFSRLTIAAPTLSAAAFASLPYPGEIDEVADGISFVPLHDVDVGPLRYWLLHLLPNLAKVARAVRRAAVVHASPSNPRWPIEFPALLIGALLRRKTISFTDIDHRRSTMMSYRSGRMSKRAYLGNRMVLDPIRWLQHAIIVRICSLVCLKGRKFAADIGKGRAHVKHFFDAAFLAEQIISPSLLAAKIAALRDGSPPLELVYFGRLTAYKGIDRCLEAIARAVAAGAGPLRFHVIGAGEQDAELRARARELGIAELVEFHGPVTFGPELFARLYRCHLLLAAPLSEDTPRSAFDAMAAGVPILAFDTAYYRELADSRAVEVVPWPSVAALAARIVELARDKSPIASMAERAVEFARQNTQEIWLRRRIEWTFALLPPPAAQPVAMPAVPRSRSAALRKASGTPGSG